MFRSQLEKNGNRSSKKWGPLPSLDDTTRNIARGIDQVESAAMMIKIMMWNMNELMMKLCVYDQRDVNISIFSSHSFPQALLFLLSMIITDHH